MHMQPTPSLPVQPFAGNDDPAGILQLLEGGQPLLHDMASGTPIMLSMPLQGCGQVTCTGVYQVPGWW